jgi:hypothetical protein
MSVSSLLASGKFLVELLHASVDETFPGLKAAVATGGMTCETVVEAATEAALEVTMV